MLFPKDLCILSFRKKSYLKTWLWYNLLTFFSSLCIVLTVSYSHFILNKAQVCLVGIGSQWIWNVTFLPRIQVSANQTVVPSLSCFWALSSLFLLRSSTGFLRHSFNAIICIQASRLWGTPCAEMDSWLWGDNMDKAWFLPCNMFWVMGTTTTWAVLQGRPPLCCGRTQREWLICTGDEHVSS